MSEDVAHLKPLPPPPARAGVEQSAVNILGWLYREALAGRIHAVATQYLRTDEDGDEACGSWFAVNSSLDHLTMIGLIQADLAHFTERYRALRAGDALPPDDAA